MVVNLRVDPFEHSIDAPAYPLYAGEKLWALMPAAAILKKFIETFEEFPPRQAGPGFNPAAMLAGVYQAAATRQGN
jgi:arylsulfatase